MARAQAFIGLALLSAAAALVATRVLRMHGLARPVPGGVLIGNVAAYDRLTDLLLTPLFRTIAADTVATVPPDARLLEVGCGPGHLTAMLAGDHGLDVVGLDLDPAMIERARANLRRRLTDPLGSSARLVAADVAALPFEDGAFDLVVSTFSLHHWADPSAGIGEIARVLRPGGRALIWDLAPSAFERFHGHVPDPTEALHAGGLQLVSARPWRWPWCVTLAQRIELAHD